MHTITVIAAILQLVAAAFCIWYAAKLNRDHA